MPDNTLFENLDVENFNEVDKFAYQTTEVQALVAEVNALVMSNEVLKEDLGQAMLALKVENIGWTNVIGGSGSVNDNGLSLENLQEVSNRCREYAAFTDLIKRGLALRASYIWSKGILIEGERRNLGKDGKPSAMGKPKAWATFYDTNETLFMNAESQQEIERLAGTDGVVLFAVPKRPSGRMMILGVHDVDRIALNPDKDDEVWAYRRKWNSRNIATGEVDVKFEWIITDKWDKGKLEVPKKIIDKDAKTGTDVSTEYVIVDVHVNRLNGWALGIPDAAAGLPYYREYNNFMKYGSDVAASMSKIIFKILNKSAAGAKQSAVNVMRPGGGGGQAASLGDGQDMQALNTAGRGYDFDSGRSLAARLASSLEVSVIHLLSDPGAAGSSYGSAQNLDMPTKRAMVLRQRVWEDAFRRIFKVVAPNEEIKIQFPPLEDPDMYREAQTRTMDWLTGLVHEDEMRQRIMDETRMKSLHEGFPEGVMLPNNEESLARHDIDTDGVDGGDTSKDSKGNARVEAASPDQGKRTGAGNAGYKDTRQDILSQTLVTAKMEMLEEKMNAILAVLEGNSK